MQRKGKVIIRGMEFAMSKGWPSKIWDAAIDLEIYTREVAKKELGK